MDDKILLSLCIPTNGICEWVFPVLDSIYSQSDDMTSVEVVVTDNGHNKEFSERMTSYAEEHMHLYYKKTDAHLFDNQIEALKLAQGAYLKFVNHRTKLLPGSLARMIAIISENIEDKPAIYWANGVLKKKECNIVCSDFDCFVRNLGRYASWTTGVGIWREDFYKIDKHVKYNPISPHSAVLFSERRKNQYIINNEVLLQEIDTDQSKKGTYDLFKAFAVFEPAITLELLQDGDISAETFKIVKKDYEKFLCELYLDFCVFKSPCSYQLDGFKDAMGIFYNKYTIILGAALGVPRRILKKTADVVNGIVRMIERK